MTTLAPATPTNQSSKVNPAKRKLPRKFETLSQRLPARAIRDEAEHESAVEMIDQLMRIDPLSPGQERYLETMVQLVEAYEARHHAIDRDGRSGPAMLSHMMDQAGMSAEQLANLLGVSRGHAYNLLRGTRALTADHLRLLGRRFNVEPSMFL